MFAFRETALFETQMHDQRNARPTIKIDRGARQGLVDKKSGGNIDFERASRRGSGQAGFTYIIHTYMYICICICIYTYTYIYIYIYIHTYIIHTHNTDIYIPNRGLDWSFLPPVCRADPCLKGVFLSQTLFVYLSICLSVYLSILKECFFVTDSMFLSIYLSI